MSGRLELMIEATEGCIASIDSMDAVGLASLRAWYVIRLADLRRMR